MKNLLITLVLLFTANSYAASNGTVSGYIKSIQIKQDGHLFIQFEENHSNPGECSQAKFVVIKSESIVFDKIFTLALTAHASNKRASFYTVTPCYEQYNTSYPPGITGSILAQ
jgi:hypothetical protein